MISCGWKSRTWWTSFWRLLGNTSLRCSLVPEGWRVRKKTTKRLREDGKITPRKRRLAPHKRVLVSTVGSDFRLIVLSSKEPFVHEAKGLDVFFTPTKRYQEVDGVRKEKERLTTDRQDSLTFHPFSFHIAWAFINLFVKVSRQVSFTSNVLASFHKELNGEAKAMKIKRKRN